MEGDGRTEMMLPIEEQTEAEEVLRILKECTYGQKMDMLDYLNVVQADITEKIIKEK